MATSRKDKSTAAPSSSSPQQMSLGLGSATSLLESADGHTRSGSPASPMTPTSGPGPAPAKGSRTRARGAGFSTLDIFGQHGSHSSRSVALQSSLESRLRARLACSGSTLFTTTWNDAVTPSGRRICALRASAPRTLDSACGSWPTPLVNDSKGSDYSYSSGDHSRPVLKLSGVAKTAVWPTPLASDGSANRDTFHHGLNNLTLTGASRLAAWPGTAHAGIGNAPTANTASPSIEAPDTPMEPSPTAPAGHWPTPRASDGAKGGKRRVKTGQDLPTTAHTASWPTPTARDWKSGASNKHGDNARPLNEVARLATWATPAAQEAGGTPEAFLARKQAAREDGTVIGVSLTSLSLQAQLADSGPMPSGSSAEIPLADRRSPGQLNPEHSRWLMGYPAAWGSCGGSATRSSRK